MSTIKLSNLENLSQAVSLVKSVINTQHGDIMVRNVALLGDNGRDLRVVATDKQIQLAVSVKSDVMLGTFDHYVSASKLHGVLSSMQSGLSLEMEADQNKVSLKTNDMKIGLINNVGNFTFLPAIEDHKKESFKIESGLFYEALKTCLPYISTSKNVAHNACFMSIKAGTATFMAAPDGSEFVSTNFPIAISNNVALMLPLKLVKILLENLKGVNCFVDVEFDDNHVQMKIGVLTIKFVREDVTFPHDGFVQKCIVDNKVKAFLSSFDLKVAELARRLRIAMQVDDKIAFSLKDGRLSFMADKKDNGDCNGALTVNSEATLQVKLSASQLLKAMSIGEVVTLHLDNQNQNGFSAKVSLPSATGKKINVWLTAMN